MILGFWLFKFVYDTFGANIYPYITLIFLLNLISTLIFYVMSGEFVKNNYVRTVFAFLFGLLYLTWISNIHELLGAIFLMSTFYTFIKWVKKGKSTYGILMTLLYILGIFSKEITFLLFPFMALVYLCIRKMSIVKKDLKKLTPLLLIFILYSIFYASTFLGYFRISNGGYKMGFDLSRMFSNFAFYLKFVLPGIGSYFNFALTILIALYGYTVYRKYYWPTIFLSGFLVLLFPVLLFSDRVSPYYVYMPTIFLFLSFGMICEFIYKMITKLKMKPSVNILILPIAIVIIVLCVFTINKGLMDDCFLIIAPWSNQTRQQFLPLVSDIRNFESTKQNSAKFDLDEKSGELVEDNGVDVIRPFLDKQVESQYTYAYDSRRNVLTVNRK